METEVYWAGLFRKVNLKWLGKGYHDLYFISYEIYSKYKL